MLLNALISGLSRSPWSMPPLILQRKFNLDFLLYTAHPAVNHRSLTTGQDPPSHICDSLTSFDLEVLVGQPIPEIEYYPVWNRFKIGGDQYIFNNRGTGYWLTPNPANKHLVADVVPTIFAVESVGGKDFVIKLPDADMVAEAIYDGISMMYGRVALRPASGSTYQHWRYV
ncbi:hypothetical protein C8R44DRAFT_865973 [Mycena epipterygia]|nr:hypothetical protein C8R44DRAFT_865973 [Mycena epipterygia]